MNGVLAVLLLPQKVSIDGQKLFDQEGKGCGGFLVTLSQKCLESSISNVTGEESRLGCSWASRLLEVPVRGSIGISIGSRDWGRGQLNFLVFCSGCDTLPEAIPWTSSYDVACV